MLYTRTETSYFGSKFQTKKIKTFENVENRGDVKNAIKRHFHEKILSSLYHPHEDSSPIEKQKNKYFQKRSKSHNWHFTSISLLQLCLDNQHSYTTHSISLLVEFTYYVPARCTQVMKNGLIFCQKILNNSKNWLGSGSEDRPI